MQFFPKFAKDKYTTILVTLRNFLAVVLAFVLSALTFSAFGQSSSAIRLTTVVIDPGHGGKDAGCISPSGKTMEKTVVLDIAKRLDKKIKAGFPEVKSIMTRDDDYFVTLQGRADIANRNNANLFISIHVNSVEKKRTGPNGYSIHILGQYTSKNKDLYAGNMDVVRRENSVITLEDDYTTKYEGFDPNDPESYIFMNLMQNAHLEKSLEFAQLVDNEMSDGPFRNSRGISQDPFYVLWRTAMPAVLIECGFMSNPEDRGKLITAEGRDQIATDIYNAFVKFKKNYDGSSSTGKTVSQTSQTQKEKPAEKAVSDEPSDESEVLYGTQVLVSSKSMAASDSFFRGYDCRKYPVGKLFKYVIGCSNDLEEARKKNKELKKYFSDSFMVKVEGGNISRL